MNNALLVIGLCCALLYFFFSRPHTGALGVASRIGIYFMMVSFGASFGYTVMGRLSLAVVRAQAMILRGPTTPQAPWPAIVAIVIIVGGLVILEVTGKLKEPGEDEGAAPQGPDAKLVWPRGQSCVIRNWIRGSSNSVRGHAVYPP